MVVRLNIKYSTVNGMFHLFWNFIRAQRRLRYLESPITLVWLAEDAGDVNSARHWNHQAALHVDVDAMRDLIDEDDRRNLF